MYHLKSPAEIYAFEQPRPVGVGNVAYLIEKHGSNDMEVKWPKDGSPSGLAVTVTCLLIKKDGNHVSGSVNNVDDEAFVRLTDEKLAYAVACKELQARS